MSEQTKNPLKAFRLARWISLDKLALKAWVIPQTLRNYERESSQFRQYRLCKKLARALEVNDEVLFWM